MSESELKLLGERWQRGDPPVLRGSRCERCGKTDFPSRSRCTGCWSPDVGDVDLPQRGIVHTYTTVHVSPHDWLDAPYSIGFVDLDDDVRVLTHLTGDPWIGADAQITELALGDRRIYGFDVDPPDRGDDA